MGEGPPPARVLSDSGCDVHHGDRDRELNDATPDDGHEDHQRCRGDPGPDGEDRGERVGLEPGERREERPEREDECRGDADDEESCLRRRVERRRDGGEHRGYLDDQDPDDHGSDGGGAGEDRSRSGQHTGCGLAIVPRVVLGYEPGDHGLQSEVEQADVDADLKDQHPHAVLARAQEPGQHRRYG